MANTSTKWKLLWSLPTLFKKSWVLFKDPLIPFGRKFLVFFISLGYLLWPLDLIPDLPLIGQIDDLFLIFFLLNWFVNKGEKDVEIKAAQDVIAADYYFSDNEERKNKE